MKNFLGKVGVAVGAALLPVVAFAQSTGIASGTFDQSSSLGKLLQGFLSFLNYLVPILVSVAVAWLIWGILQYVLKADDEEERGKAKSTIVYGVVGIVIMVSVYGLVNLVQSSLGFDVNQNIKVPTIDATSRIDR